jgi:hypothetical protein
VPIGITKEGRWLTGEHAENLLQGKPIHEPRHLHAGDPKTTPGAAVLPRICSASATVQRLAIFRRTQPKKITA